MRSGAFPRLQGEAEGDVKNDPQIKQNARAGMTSMNPAFQ